MKRDQNYGIRRGYQARRYRYMWVCLLLGMLVLGLMAVTMLYGHTVYTPGQVLRALRTAEAEGAFTIRTLRLPRMLAGLLCGMAFGLAGNTFQKLLGNPLASPDIVGVSSGASAAAVFALLVLRVSGGMVQGMAMLSSLLVAGIIYGIAHGRGYTNGRLILTGIGMQAILQALISWMMLKGSRYDVGAALRWMNGSLNQVTMAYIPYLALVVLLVGMVLMLLGRYLHALQLGEDYATVLGVRLAPVRIALMLCALLLTGSAASVSGPIASVAFLAGPIALRLSGGGDSAMLASALVGSILVLGGDLIGQYALPARYPVGVVTGILGAPYLLYLLLRMNKKGE